MNASRPAACLSAEDAAAGAWRFASPTLRAITSTPAIDVPRVADSQKRTGDRQECRAGIELPRRTVCELHTDAALTADDRVRVRDIIAFGRPALSGP